MNEILPSGAVEPPAGGHRHDFAEGNPAAERGTRIVMWLTAATMAIEIAAGWWFNSMALVADGLHMSSHALAIGLSAFAYAASRRYAGDARFAFGSWKIEVLAAFTSALVLLGVALAMFVPSVERLADPRPIAYVEAITVAFLGLAVNIVCALILQGAQGRAHGHAPHDDHHGKHGHHDINLRAAYLHVVADAVTSVLAIVALAGGLVLGWAWLDPAMGIAGAALVVRWSIGLLRDSARVLLDAEMDHPLAGRIRDAIAALDPAGGTRVTDFHLWRVGRSRYACIVSIATSAASLDAARVKSALGAHPEIAHLTVEVDRF